MISSVNASENISLDNSADEVLANCEISEVADEDSLEIVDDEAGDVLKQTAGDNLAVDNASQNVASPTGTEKMNIDAILNSEYVWMKEDQYFYVHLPKSVAKDVSIYIDGNLTKVKIDPYIDEEPLFELDFDKLGLGVGKHALTFSFPGNSRFAPINKTYDLNIVHFHAFIPKTNWGDESYLFVDLSDYTCGTIYVIVDNKVKAKYKTEDIPDEDYIFMPGDIGYGTHDVEVRYEGKLGTYSATGKYVKSYIDCSLEEGFEISWGDLSEVYIYGEKKFSNTVNVKIGGKTLKAKITKGDGSVTIPKSLLKIGKNTLTLSYSGDKNFPAFSKKIDFYMIPKIESPYEIAYGDSESVVMYAPKGTYVIYEKVGNDEYDYKLKKIKSGSYSGSFVNLPKLNVGEHMLRIEYKAANGFVYDRDFDVVVFKNSNGFKSSISPKTVKYGHEFKVKLTSPKLKKYADILVDGLCQDISISMKKGVGVAKFPIMSAGKHKVTVNFHSGSKFYSKTFYVTVKKPTSYITLNKVALKKSAKKVVLKAKIKTPKGKAIKGKKVTFKFKGKTFKAKSNKKGVAKVAIKKPILNKLKVGKTVKYSATYQYTVTKSAKVKK